MKKLTETRIGLLLIIFLSVILRGLIIICQPDAVINSDGVYYISAAKHFATGNFRDGLAIYPMPFYPLLIAAAHYFLPNWLIAGRIISMASLVLVLIPLYMLARDLFDRRAAFWGCLMFALSPVSMGLTTTIMREQVFALFFIWAVYFAQRAIHSKRALDLFAAAIFSCASILCRLEGIILFPVYLFILIGFGMVKRARMKIYLTRAFIWFAVFTCLLLLVFVTLKSSGMASSRSEEYAEHMQGFFNLKFLDNYRHVYAELERLDEASPHGWCQSFAGTAKRFIGTIYLLGLLQYFVRTLFIVNMAPLLWGLRRSLLRETHLFVLILSFSYLAGVFYIFVRNDFVAERFLLAPALMLYPWVGMGIGKMLDFVRRLSYGELLSAALLAVLVASPANKFNHLYKKGDDSAIRAGMWLASQPALQNARVAGDDPRIFYYAGREISADGSGRNILWHDNGDETYNGIEQVALRNHIDVIIVSTTLRDRISLDNTERYGKLKEFIGKKEKVIFYYTGGDINSNG